MPVFHRVESGVLVVTVDGDFTVEETERVGSAALQASELIAPAFVILDLSGAAGLAPESERVERVTTLFAGPQAPVARLAVVAAAELADAVVGHARDSGLESAAFRSRSDAMDWLLAM